MEQRSRFVRLSEHNSDRGFFDGNCRERDIQLRSDVTDTTSTANSLT